MTKIKTRLLALLLAGTLSLSAAAISSPAAWAAPEVTAAAQLQLVPYELLSDYEKPTARAEFCKLVCQLLCEYTNSSFERLSAQLFPDGYDKTPFVDTDDKYIALCAAAGIVDGRDEGKFDPLSAISREEAAKLLALTAGVIGDTQDRGAAPDFVDSEIINEWAKPFVRFVSAAGIMNGRDGGEFDPRGKYSRQESILTFYRLYLTERGAVRQALRECGYPYLNFGADAYSIFALANGGEGQILRAAFDERHAGGVFALNPEKAAAMRLVPRDTAGNILPTEIGALGIEQKKAAQKKAVDLTTSGIITLGIALKTERREQLYIRITQDGAIKREALPIVRPAGYDAVLEEFKAALGSEQVTVGSCEVFNDLYYASGGRVDFSRPMTVTVYSEEFSESVEWDARG